MQSFSMKIFLALFAFHTLFVEASHFINALPPRMRQDAFVQVRATKGTGTVTKASAAGLGVTNTATSAKATATSALNATVLDCQIIVSNSCHCNPPDWVELEDLSFIYLLRYLGTSNPSHCSWPRNSLRSQGTMLHGCCHSTGIR
jgi:hypothetical protein